MREIAALHDPCPLPDKQKKRSLNERERLMYAPMSGEWIQIQKLWRRGSTMTPGLSSTQQATHSCRAMQAVCHRD